MPLNRNDWLRILDPETKITHHAYPYEENKDLYITICNIIVTTKTYTSNQTQKTGWVIIDRTEELTCDDCISWISMGPVESIEGNPES